MGDLEDNPDNNRASAIDLSKYSFRVVDESHPFDRNIWRGIPNFRVVKQGSRVVEQKSIMRFVNYSPADIYLHLTEKMKQIVVNCTNIVIREHNASLVQELKSSTVT